MCEITCYFFYVVITKGFLTHAFLEFIVWSCALPWILLLTVTLAFYGLSIIYSMNLTLLCLVLVLPERTLLKFKPRFKRFVTASKCSRACSCFSFFFCLTKPTGRTHDCLSEGNARCIVGFWSFKQHALTIEDSTVDSSLGDETGAQNGDSAGLNRKDTSPISAWAATYQKSCCSATSFQFSWTKRPISSKLDATLLE